jgi:hypothetical protein
MLKKVIKGIIIMALLFVGQLATVLYYNTENVWIGLFGLILSVIFILVPATFGYNYIFEEFIEK